MADSPIAQVTLVGPPIPMPNPLYRSVEQVCNGTVNLVKERLGGSLYTSNNPGADLALTQLSELSGKVVATFDGEFSALWSAKDGVFPYRDIDDQGQRGGSFSYSNIPQTSYGLRIFDHYSDTGSLGDI